MQKNDETVGISGEVRCGERVFIASTAYVGGDVSLGDGVSVWHHVAVRGDVAAIRIGSRCNVQDGAVLHCRSDVPLEIEEDVAIGHRAVVHCRRVGKGSLIGINAVVLDDAVVGRGCIVAAGAVVRPGTEIPDGMLVAGVPAQIKRPVTAEEAQHIAWIVDRYVALGQRHARGDFPNAAGC